MVVDGSNVSGWVFYDSETVLAELVLWLHRTMPRIQMPYGSPVNSYVEGRSVRSIQFPADRNS